uniref:Uncharacterized protein n=1 Tax=Desertifilum tharense IPPAS B-1220 TaxID=1781255 RepID=A0ACD5GXQ7_9CYAN
MELCTIFPLSTQHYLPTQHTATRKLKQQHFTLSTHFPHSEHRCLVCKLRNSELCTPFPHPPISPSPHPLPHSALSTLHSALLSPLSTQHFALSTPFPTQHSALCTQHSFPHSALSTLHSALKKALAC